MKRPFEPHQRIASASSIDRLARLLSEYYYETIRIEQDGEQYKIHGTKSEKTNTAIFAEKVRGQYKYWAYRT